MTTLETRGIIFMSERETASVRAFVTAFLGSLLSIMSGGLSVPITILGFYVSEPTARYAFVGLGMVSLIVSAYFMWRSERLKVIELEDSLPDGFEHHFANVRVADAPSVLALLDGPERAKLITLLSGGLMPAWARPSSTPRHDLVALSMTVWNNFNVEFYSKGDQPGHINQTFLKHSGFQHSEYYDLCMNKAQLLRAWPGLDIPESKCDIL